VEPVILPRRCHISDIALIRRVQHGPGARLPAARRAHGLKKGGYFGYRTPDNGKTLTQRHERSRLALFLDKKTLQDGLAGKGKGTVSIGSKPKRESQCRQREAQQKDGGTDNRCPRPQLSAAPDEGCDYSGEPNRRSERECNQSGSSQGMKARKHGI
jgi:hypothetical protein